MKHEEMKPDMKYVFAYHCSCGAHFESPESLKWHLEIEMQYNEHVWAYWRYLDLCYSIPWTWQI